MTQRDPERFEVVDTRPEQFFDLGNIKGSKSLPWESLLDTRGRFLEVDDIVKLLASHDINLAKPIVASCQTGKTSTVLNVALQ
jgi:3-mercaptopyruvate sulfurtransferase SseA